MWRIQCLGAIAVLALVFPFQITAQNPQSKEVTFSKDVAPIVFEKCAYCHRPGEIAPMALLNYKDVRPWARSIKEKVVQRLMPPWGADSHFGDFSNERRLSDSEIQTFVSWVDGGAKEGSAADLPALPQFAEGWQIGTPDLIVSMPKPFTIPATGTIPWTGFVSDYVFPEDTWVQAIEVRPGNRRVVHHATAIGVPAGTPDEMVPEGSVNLHLYSPGMEAMIWRDGYGKLIPKGTSIRLGMHYNTIGQETTDQTTVGFKFAKAPVHTEVHTTTISNSTMLVPPNVRSQEIIGAFQFQANARIHAFRPHMHLRGKTGTASLITTEGKRRVLLHVPQFDDSWQYYYVLSEPAQVSKRDIVEFVGNFDNSAGNPFNPDPSKPVVWGQQIWDEMHTVYMTWTEVNEKNKNDLQPIQIPPSKAFTTGLTSSR